MYLLDTVVISDTAKRRPTRQVDGWLDRQDSNALFLSVVTLGEIQHGIATVRRRDPAFAQRLSDWLVRLRGSYADRVLPFTMEVALRWGALCAEIGHKDVDLMIAATALEHDLTVVTRNRRHFQDAGVKLFDPFGE